MRALLVATMLFLGCASTPRTRIEVVEPTTCLERLMFRLMADAPPARPLGVTLIVADEDDGNMGYALEIGPDNWIIQIDASLDEDAQWIVLTHEWAHVLQGDGGCGLEGSHGPTFGVAWAAAWRAAVGEEN